MTGVLALSVRNECCTSINQPAFRDKNANTLRRWWFLLSFSRYWREPTQKYRRQHQSQMPHGDLLSPRGLEWSPGLSPSTA